MKIFPTVLSVSLAEHLNIFLKIFFICNNKCISENNTYNEGGIGRWEIDCSMEH